MARLNTLTPGSKEAGLSLVELLIAMTLGLLLTLGVTQIFLASSQTYRLNDGLSLLQENMRFVLGNLQHDGRMAGHYGCLVGAPENLLDETPPYDANVYDVGRVAAMGWEANGTGLGDSFTITSLTPAGTAWSNGTGDSLPTDISGDIVPGTDVLLINGGEPADVELSGNPKASNAAIGTTNTTNIAQGAIILAVAGDCSGADLFQKSNSKNSSGFSKGAGTGGMAPGNENPSGGFSATYDNDANVYQFFSKAYYIGQGANGEPALFRDRLDAGDPFGAVELIAGVENMQVLYGVGTGQAATSYLEADNVTDWRNVVSIRIALLMRSNDDAVDEQSAGTFNLLGTQITTASDRRGRLVGVATVGIRNRLE